MDRTGRIICISRHCEIVPSAMLRHRCVSGSERSQTAGLPRRSCLTARNDDVPFCRGLRVKPAMTAFFNPVHLLILKILIQTKK